MFWTIFGYEVLLSLKWRTLCRHSDRWASTFKKKAESENLRVSTEKIIKTSNTEIT
jgi:hypothetical protein